jgi:glycosyltransferase involved in cell wall biosynthesis
MARADALAFCSRWEGLPCVLVEALALGTPVVATDCPSGPAEILENGKFGALVPVDDHEAMAGAIIKTLSDPLSPEVLRQAARPYGIGAATDAYLRAMGLQD